MSELLFRTFEALALKLGIASERVAVGVSGGRDSMALSLLAKKTIRNVTAITVDHRLRSESELEAKFVQTQMTKMCIPHSVVQCSWPHSHPVKSQLQQQARQARYHLLATECARLKINHLLLAHQLNDQIETVIHRIGRASGIDGLSGMKMVTRWKSNSSLLLIRPLLNFTREDVTEFCLDNGISWLDDPSNENKDFRRVAIRSSLASVLSHSNVSIRDLQEVTEMVRDANDIANNEVAHIIKSCVTVIEEFGYVELDVSSIAHLSAMTLNRLFSKLLMYVSGLRYPPSLESVYKLLTNNIMNQRRLSLPPIAVGGCLVFVYKTSKLDKSLRLVICRQPAERSEESQSLSMGERLWWDGRFVISSQLCNQSADWKSNPVCFNVRSLKKLDFLLLKCDKDACDRLHSVPLFCRLALPVICNAATHTVVSIPHLRYTNGSEKIEWKITPCPRHPLPQQTSLCQTKEQ